MDFEQNNNENGWYSGAVEAPERKRKTTRRILIGLLFVLAAIALLAGLAFRSASENGISDEGYWEEEYPSDWHDFFQQYYKDPDDITSEKVNVERSEYHGDFSLALDSSDPAVLSLPDLYNRCIPSVVTVQGTEDKKKGVYFGTGIILSSDGLIVTNTHIIEGCDKSTVILQDGTEYPATLIGADSISDISVLKIEADGLTPATFASSDQLRVGSDCVAIGNPVNTKLTGTMTNGIISAINRDITVKGHTMTLIQTNAAINEGNSGGPLLDMGGRVIGITNMKVMSSESTVEGIGFAIPSSTVADVVAQLLSSGSYSGRPAIGVIVSPVTKEIAEHYDIPEGLYIASVSKGSDAEKQGIQSGDILTAVNGAAVTTNEEVTAIKNSLQVGDPIHLTVWRDGNVLEFDVQLMEASSLD